MNNEYLPIELSPYDKYNQALRKNVAPPEWQNPQPKQRYNLVVIGAGTAGLVAAAGAAGLGARVALVERKLMGGDCLNTGCVPSKALLTASMNLPNIVDRASLFRHALSNMRDVRSQISHHDSADRFAKLGVDVFLGNGVFTGRSTVQITSSDGSACELQFAKAIIASGSTAAIPPIEGLKDISFLTNESLFSIEELPASLVVIGGGPIGVEMAQMFARFGTKVTLIQRSARLLPQEVPAASKIVQASLVKLGVDVLCNTDVSRVTQAGHICVHTSNGPSIHCERLLIATGRQPRVSNMNLEAAGVDYDHDQGILVNDNLRTTNKNIFAAGDVSTQFRFTHAADFMARTAIQNALFLGRKKTSKLLIPHCTYGLPEIASVGQTPRHHQNLDVYHVDMSDVDRAKLESHTEGFCELYTRHGKNRVVGATIVAPHAGEMINFVTLAIQNRIGLGKIAACIHPYPTFADGIRKCGDQYNKQRLTPLISSLFRKWLQWSR